MIPDLSRDAARTRDIAFWQRLHTAGLVTSPTMPLAREQTPWFLRAITGVAAWIAAILLTLAVGLLVMKDWRHLPETGFAMVGLALALAAGAGLRAKLGTFLTQGLVSLSLAGQLMVACGLVLFRDGDGPGAVIGGLALGVLGLVLYVMNSVALHRFICGIAMAFALYFMLSGNPFHDAFSGNGMMVISVLLPLALNAVAVGLWAAARPLGAHPGLAPLTWAFTLCATGLSFTGAWFDNEPRLVMPALIATSLVPGIFAVLLMWPTRKIVGMRMAALVPLVLLLLSPVWLRMPGIGLAVIWMIGGFALARPLLLAFGIACLPLYLLRYIYMVDLTLLEKSMWLTGTGLGLLLLWGIWQAAITHHARRAIAAGAVAAKQESTS
jgi:hypothetical protein